VRVEEERARKLVDALAVGAEALTEIARTAARNRKPLTGSGFYANRFHGELVKLVRVEALMMPVVRSIVGFDPQQLVNDLGTVKSETAGFADRDAARKRIRLVCETEILPNIANLGAPIQPRSEPVLATAVLASAPTYLQRTLLQANGCYENRWFEASSVMIRKLVENLIIDVYEKHKKQSEIQKDGEYFMLAGLVTAILNQNHWQLQRETRKTLPDIKKLGDRAAHNRRYWATQGDIDKILTGLRAAVDDLLHLAGHK
jgi:hypothetical protein